MITANVTTVEVPQPPVVEQAVVLTVPLGTGEALLPAINDLFLSHGDRDDATGEAVREFWTAAVNLAAGL